MNFHREHIVQHVCCCGLCSLWPEKILFIAELEVREGKQVLGCGSAEGLGELTTHSNRACGVIDGVAECFHFCNRVVQDISALTTAEKKVV